MGKAFLFPAGFGFSVKSKIMKSILNKEKPVIIAGPCSAESQEQLVEVAKELSKQGVEILRAGIWKPRTRPGSFEGVGSIGLKWMQAAKLETGMKIATEVANVKHVYEALSAGVDLVWIGARTTSNPFAVQEIANALQGVNIPVLVKNPINPDVDLWVGAIERLKKAGIKEVGAIHRGVSYYGKGLYRNNPEWQMPIELKKRIPGILLINDPSHIAGKRSLLLTVAQKAMDLDFDGLMIEVHPKPQMALSDAEQQITPEELTELRRQLIIRSEIPTNHIVEDLDSLRGSINQLDHDILDLLSIRMDVARNIGSYKKQNKMTVLQQTRWNHLLDEMVEKGSDRKLSGNFIEKVYKCIHEESINQQIKVVNSAKNIDQVGVI